MFRNKKIKIHVSGWPALCLLIAIMAVLLLLAITLPYFGFFGLFNILAKFNLASMELFEKGYQNFFYFEWLLILIIAMVIILDLISLMIIAGSNLKLAFPISTMSTIIQFLLSLTIFKKVIIPSFQHVQITWKGSLILFLLIYLVTSVFNHETPKEKKVNS
ncbi:SepA family multidrug efflux transporter [Rummeliibacillus sp. G93]|uniref:Uncharacterized protein n=1 Tax=Rummeliibacillus stabekisii TaxID=241244 RepID=A0A143HGU3_9BACL|nr:MULTISPECIES: SepA family multidrug efflux transporter [Rummeliibacillus]AMX00716.1 hypothetical protein ATY39_15705 [Rummeliibacillus stabekisii]MBB5171767.1 putative membrane protein [Rummeliibacillus stabekisii]MCM3318167.1 SepA family multidrug efflux transporter [Rummeliibacillus stabekisii]UQW97556.1 SepA family multidrug efflux transporter [Rummeliibacillus sp. G93]GEL06484.1 hypothetical protein RST01_31110 [Rummeliibacillus stabekisii]